MTSMSLKSLANLAGRSSARRRRSAPVGMQPAFSLLETTIAVGILGVGLILVAAIFPAALTQHRESADLARTIETVSKAQAMIGAKVNAADLWVDPIYLPGGALMNSDSPWYLLPTVNLRMGNDCWDVMVQGTGGSAGLYANYANGAPVGAGNTVTLLGLDILSDRLAPFTLFNSGSSCTSTGDGLIAPSGSPFTDAELMDVPNRQVWYGFYRRLATGSIEFAAATCKQRKKQVFAEQDVFNVTGGFTPFSRPAVWATDRRLPVPWRVTVAASSGFGNVFSNASTTGGAFAGTLGLARMAPVGTKFMLTGAGQSFGASMISIPSGRVLTVSDYLDDFSVEVVGDLAGIPTFNFTTGLGVTFDIWVFPPAVDAGDFGRVSPNLDWKVPL